MRKRLERRKERVGEIDWCACGRAKRVRKVEGGQVVEEKWWDK